MSDTLSVSDFHLCLQRLQADSAWRSPHGVNLEAAYSAATAEKPDGSLFSEAWDFNETPLTEAKWNAISWPNDLFRVCILYDKDSGDGETYTKALLTPDPAASPKPTWALLQSTLHGERKALLLNDQREHLRFYVMDRICREVYGAKNITDEILNRLNDGETAEQIAERKRLLAKHKEIRATLASKTLAELKAFNPESDALWAKE